MMKVEVIQNENQLEKLEPFYIDNLLWGTKNIPKTYGYIGFVPEDAFYIEMVCEETKPLCNYTQDTDPVYRDSAMEAFLQFETDRERIGSPTYLNFEANANGALLASYGKERTYRSYFTKDMYKEFRCRTTIEEECWKLFLRIPVRVLEEIYGPLCLKKGSTFSCNFYKISEAKEIEHYASYAPIHSKTQSFHQTEFFEQAVIVDTHNS